MILSQEQAIDHQLLITSQTGEPPTRAKTLHLPPECLARIVDGKNAGVASLFGLEFNGKFHA